MSYHCPVCDHHMYDECGWCKLRAERDDAVARAAYAERISTRNAQVHANAVTRIEELEAELRTDDQILVERFDRIEELERLVSRTMKRRLVDSDRIEKLEATLRAVRGLAVRRPALAQIIDAVLPRDGREADLESILDERDDALRKSRAAKRDAL